VLVAKKASVRGVAETALGGGGGGALRRTCPVVSRGAVNDKPDMPFVIVSGDPIRGASSIVGLNVGGKSSPSSSPENDQVLPGRGLDSSSALSSSGLGTTIVGASLPSVQLSELNSRSNSLAQSCGVRGSGRKSSNGLALSLVVAGWDGPAAVKLPHASSCQSALS